MAFLFGIGVDICRKVKYNEPEPATRDPGIGWQTNDDKMGNG